MQLVKNDSCIESLTVANNTHVTGLFLTGSNPPKLTSLAFFNCYSLQGTVLSAAIDNIPTLTTLKLDVCPVSMWKIIPNILNKLQKLEELSLSEYTSVEMCVMPQGNEAFCTSLSKLSDLRMLNLSRNIYITNAVLKQVAQSCPKLQSLNVSSCNSRKNFTHAGKDVILVHYKRSVLYKIILLKFKSATITVLLLPEMVTLERTFDVIIRVVCGKSEL